MWAVVALTLPASWLPGAVRRGIGNNHYWVRGFSLRWKNPCQLCFAKIVLWNIQNPSNSFITYFPVNFPPSPPATSPWHHLLPPPLNTPGMPSHNSACCWECHTPSSLSVDSYIFQDQMLFPPRNHPFLLQEKLSIPSMLSTWLMHLPLQILLEFTGQCNLQPQDLLLVSA